MSETIVSTDPRNNPLNLLNEGAWALRIQRIPKTSFLCKNIILPTVSIDSIPVKGYHPQSLNMAGTKITYGSLNLTFKVDENLSNYQEILLWMKHSVGDPDGTSLKKLISDSRIGRGPTERTYNIYSQGSLITTTNHYKNNLEIVLEDLFPTEIGGLTLTQETDNSVNIECDITFSCSSFTIRPIV